MLVFIFCPAKLHRNHLEVKGTFTNDRLIRFWKMWNGLESEHIPQGWPYKRGTTVY